MYVCMYVCMYICMYVCVYIYIYIYVYIYIYTHVCMYVYIYIHIYLSLSLYIYIYTYIVAEGANAAFTEEGFERVARWMDTKETILVSLWYIYIYIYIWYYTISIIMLYCYLYDYIIIIIYDIIIYTYLLLSLYYCNFMMSLLCRARTKVVLVKVVSWIVDYFPEQYIIYIHIPVISLHNYILIYDNTRLFRKPSLLGPPLSCANYHRIIITPFAAVALLAKLAFKSLSNTTFRYRL